MYHRHTTTYTGVYPKITDTLCAVGATYQYRAILRDVMVGCPNNPALMDTWRQRRLFLTSVKPANKRLYREK